MTDQSFSTTLTVDQTPAEVFAAVVDTRGWWSQDIDGPTDELGGEFTYHYEDVHRSTMRVTGLVPYEKVTWLCLANSFNFVQDATEWTGTTVTFDISRAGDKTLLRFTHHGLTPDYECFDVCENAWSGYVNGSLKDLITSGTGSANNAVRNAEALTHQG